MWCFLCAVLLFTLPQYLNHLFLPVETTTQAWQGRKPFPASVKVLAEEPPKPRKAKS